MTHPAPAPTTAAEPAPAMSHREVLEALSGILLGLFVSILATSVVSSALPQIVADLGGSQTSFTWVVTATLLTTTVSTPIWGKLADLVDRKVLIQIALVITVVSAAAAGLAHSTAWLIGMRAAQGLGAGGLTALGTVLIADLISPRERGRYMGILGGVMGVAMVGGPLLGGVLTDGPGWRWTFFVSAPFALAALVVLQRTLHLARTPRRVVRIDVWGALLLSAGVTTVLLWVTFAGDSFDWLSWQTVAMLGGGTGLLLGFVLPLHLMRNRTLVLAVIASVAVGVALFGTSVFLSQYMQVARGRTPTESGLLTIPMVLGQLLASILGGRLVTRTGRYKTLMLIGSVVLAAGLALMGTIHDDTALWEVGLFMAVLGTGVGLLMQNLVLATQNTLALEDTGSGTAAVAFFRTLGGAVGVSALGAVLASRVTTLVTDGLAAIGIDVSAIGGGAAVPDVSALPGPVRAVVESAYGDAIADLFLVAAPMALVAFVAVLLLREVPLGTRSGVEELLAREAAVETGAAVEEPVRAG
jgi:EmrB/QacA subfamily drug resistance transporter